MTAVPPDFPKRTASDPEPPPGDLPLETLRRHGHEVVEWVARYLEEIERYPVLSRAEPGDVRRALPAGPPAAGEDLSTILADLDRHIVPGLTHWNHPGFLGYFAISGTVPGVLAETLAAALNVNGMLWRTSPALTELEQVVTGWLASMIGLDDRWFGVLNDTASTSTFVALAAAREADPSLDVRAGGLAGRPTLPRMRVYASEHAHSSVDKAVIALGLGADNLVRVACDADHRMRTELLASAIAADRRRGWRPVAVVATAGTTGTTSVDPLGEIALLCREEGVWLHVDAAYAGAAALLPEMRGLFAGWEQADSIVVNPHKWLFTPVGVSALFVRQPAMLRRAFALVPEYLDSSRSDEVVNYMDYGLQLGKPFRALKLWFVLRAFGTDGLAARLRYQIGLARELAAAIEAEDGWKLAAPALFSTVCFRHLPLPGEEESAADARNLEIMNEVNRGGAILLSHTRLQGRIVLRAAIGNIRTERRHIEAAWALLRSAARGTISATATPPRRRIGLE